MAERVAIRLLTRGLRPGGSMTNEVGNGGGGARRRVVVFSAAEASPQGCTLATRGGWARSSGAPAMPFIRAPWRGPPREWPAIRQSFEDRCRPGSIARRVLREFCVPAKRRAHARNAMEVSVRVHPASSPPLGISPELLQQGSPLPAGDAPHEVSPSEHEPHHWR